MKKKLSAILLTVCLCLVFPLMVFADTSVPKLVDEAGLLTESEFQQVEAALKSVSEKYGVDVAIVTVNGLGGKSIMQYADDYYDQNGYGTGTDRSGVLWLIDMDSRETYLTTAGEGYQAVTDYGRSLLADEVNPYLSQQDYAQAMLNFAYTIDDYFAKERAGIPVDTYGGSERQKSAGPGVYIILIIVSLAGGFLLSFAVTGAMKKKMLTVRKQSTANAYVDRQGLLLTENSDRFMYHRVVAVPIPRNDGPRGGGSSLHTSGGGVTHGGGSMGKF